MKKLVLAAAAVLILGGMGYSAWFDYATTPAALRGSPPASSSVTPSISHDESLKLFVHYGTRGLRITNDTEQSWDRCTVTVTGDFETEFPVLKPRDTVEVYYEKFAAGKTPLNVDDGYARALRGTKIVCTGGDDRLHQATLR